MSAAAPERDATGIAHELDELYPGLWALLLVPVCNPDGRHRHRVNGEPQPCQAPGKAVLERDWNAQAAKRWTEGTGREERIAEMAERVSRGSNLGLAVPPGVVALDADTPEAAAYLDRALPDAPAQDTAKGLHVLARVPHDLALDATVRLEVAPGVRLDVRSAGRSQIVVEPSIHASGARYSWRRPLPERPDEIPDCPPVLLEALGAREQTRGTGAAGKIGSGERNAYLYRCGCGMRGRGLSEGEIRDELHHENARRCDPPLERGEVEQIVQSVMRHAAGEAGADNEGERTAPQLVTLSSVQPEPVEWLWAGRIPLGKLTVLDGDPGLGKSLVTLDLAARVSTGDRMPDGTPGIEGGAGVVLLSAEDGLGDTIRPRLEAAGADLMRVVALVAMPTDDGPRPLELPEDVLAIERAVREVGARLLVVDPLMAFLAGAVNANRDHDVRRALAPLAAMADRTGAAVLTVRHLNKGGSASGNALYRGGGSIGIVGAARSGLLAARDPDDPDVRVLAITKANLAAPVPALRWRIADGPDGILVDWLGVSEHTAASLMAEPEGEERTARDEAAEWLRDALRDGPRPAADLLKRARADGIQERTLRRARERIGARAVKAEFSGGWTWAL